MSNIAIVGVEQSGKTALMISWGWHYFSPDCNGYYLSPDPNGGGVTRDFICEEMHRMKNGKWPDATSPDSVKKLNWILGRGGKSLGEMSFIDFGGEIYRKAFKDGPDARVGFELSNGSDCSGWKDKEFAGEKAATHPVGKKAANNWGFHDMIGNVYEWGQDWYGSDYDKNSPFDPTGPASGDYRVLRGGGWRSDARYCRSANRFVLLPGYRYGSYGFRLCCSAK